MKKVVRNWLFDIRMKLPFILAALFLGSCTGLRYSTEERPLYTGFTIQWTDVPEYDGSGAKRELEELVTPSANGSMLGMRPMVALHNTVKEPERKKGWRHWLKYKVGAEPVYLEQVPVADINGAMVNRLNNRGHFEAKSTAEVIQKGRRASVEFTVSPGAAHTIADIRMGEGASDALDSALVRQRSLCAIGIGDPYDLSRLTEERARVSDRLRDQGWFKLRADDLIWTADTTLGDRSVVLDLRVKPYTAATKRQVYRVASVTVHSDEDDVLPPTDTLIVDSIRYVSYLDTYRPEPILKGVLVRPGETYSLARADAMQRYLGSYGVFQNVLVAFGEDTTREGLLNARVALMPMKRFSFFGEANMVSKSNNFAGPGLRGGYVDRNLLGGAEQFTLDVNGRFEWQVSGRDQGTNAYEVGIKSALAIPRMLLLPDPKGLRSSTPVTNLAIGFGIYRRINLYGMRTAVAGLGYTWRRDNRVWHDLQLLEISYNNLSYTTPEFDAFLAENPTIQRSFEDQFIVGLGYTYTRSTKARPTQRNWFVYSLGADESGNLISVIQTAVGGPVPDEGRTLLGERYSQYFRVRPELRWYQSLGTSGAQLVTRLLTHAGFSYGNSDVIPYVKQFYAGGTNSLRGFRARSVGPGSYVSVQEGNFLVDQVGDLKLEFNAEYRFPIAGFVKGAFFTDAGNIWLLNDDPSRPGGVFAWDTFLSQIAMDLGFGVRIDPQVIVIRLDLAAPIRRPEQPQGDRWVLGGPNGDWLNNLILNIAIGYPF